MYKKEQIKSFAHFNILKVTTCLWKMGNVFIFFRYPGIYVYAYDIKLTIPVDIDGQITSKITDEWLVNKCC